MRNAMYEQALTKSGIKFEYRDAVPLDEINATRGRQMQARLLPLEPALIDEYDRMLQDGLEPPPLLLWKHGKSLLVPLDGNQRIAANSQTPAKYRLKKFSAYVVALDDLQVVDRLCWSFNNLVNGRRLSYDECLTHAITFVRKYGWGHDKSAKEWGVKTWELSARVREEEMRDLAARHNIETKNVPRETILLVNPLEKIGQEVVTKVLRTVAQSGVDGAAVKELVHDVSKAKTLEIKQRLVDEFCASEKVARSAAATKNGRLVHKKGRSPKEQLHKLLEQAETLLDEFKDLKAFKPSGRDERERYSGSSLFVCNKLIQVYGLGALLKGQGVE